MQKDINILVVDDEEVMRSLFTDILQDRGYNVITACDGKEAHRHPYAGNEWSSNFARH